jgi:uncharacterized protein (DUF58 family)
MTAEAPRLTPHAGRFLTVAAVLLLAGVVGGRVELVAFGVAAAAVLGMKAARPMPSLAVAFGLSADRLVEGENVQVTISLTATGDVDHASVSFVHSSGLVVVEGAELATLTVPSGETRDVTLRVRPRRWGVYSFGPVIVTWCGRGGLVGGVVTVEPETLRVLPKPEEFAAPAAHPFTRALSGTHVARVSGEGIEPAGVREYRPGDPLRRVNWRVTARRGDLYVTEQRPERNAEVVLFLDTFVDRGPEGATTLDVAVRAAAGIAEHYLATQDRVGVVGFGGVLRWVYADSGRVQRYRILEHLLGMGSVATYAAKDVSVIPARSLPPRARVNALSPLLDSRATGTLADLAKRGYGLVVVDTSPRPLLPQARTWSRDLAQRVFLVERDVLISRLGEVGVPVVPWAGPGTLDVVLAEVSRLHARPKVGLR